MNKTNWILLLVVAFIVVVVCVWLLKGDSKKPDEPPPVVIKKDEDWGGNLTLHVEKIETSGRIRNYTICSRYNGVPVGFLLQVPVDISRFGEGVTFKSLGDTSDNFIKMLYNFYQLNTTGSLKFVKSISCKYAGLNDLPYKGNGEKRLSKVNYLKVFFEGCNETEYGEIFLNIDEPNKTIKLEEKDYEYRPYIAMLLTAE